MFTIFKVLTIITSYNLLDFYIKKALSYGLKYIYNNEQRNARFVFGNRIITSSTSILFFSILETIVMKNSNQIYYNTYKTNDHFEWNSTQLICI